MRQLSHRSRATTATVILFAFAAVCFGVALILPIAESWPHETVPGIVAIAISLEGVWDFIGLGATLDTDGEPTPHLLAVFANLTLLASAARGWSLRRKHAVWMFLLSLNGLAAGLSVLLWAREEFGIIYAGYWAWIASLTFVAADWGSVVWNQRRARSTAIPGDGAPA